MTADDTLPPYTRDVETLNGLGAYVRHLRNAGATQYGGALNLSDLETIMRLARAGIAAQERDNTYELIAKAYTDVGSLEDFERAIADRELLKELAMTGDMSVITHRLREWYAKHS